MCVYKKKKKTTRRASPPSTPPPRSAGRAFNYDVVFDDVDGILGLGVGQWPGANRTEDLVAPRAFLLYKSSRSRILFFFDDGSAAAAAASPLAANSGVQRRRIIHRTDTAISDNVNNSNRISTRCEKSVVDFVSGTVCDTIIYENNVS